LSGVLLLFVRRFIALQNDLNVAQADAAAAAAVAATAAASGEPPSYSNLASARHIFRRSPLDLCHWL
jgi:hypothetical protein